MGILSIDHLSIANAMFLVVLGTYFLQRNRTIISGVFFMQCFCMAAWNVTAYMLNNLILPEYVDAVAKLQLVLCLLFSNGILYFTHLYPYNNIGHWHIPNLIFTAGMSVTILFTDFVTSAEIVNNKVVFTDGLGFAVLGMSFAVYSVATIYRIIRSYRDYTEYRDRLKYFIIGLLVFVSLSLTFNLVLPSLNNYDYLIVGRLGATAFMLFMFYAMTKHEFLDATVIINKRTSWLVVLGFLVTAFLLFDSLTRSNDGLHILMTGSFIVVAALFAQSLQKFLLTTAKRKFVRGWYSTEEVFKSLSEKITEEKNRESLFREVLAVLDEVFELEYSLSVVAIRDENEKFSYYRIQNDIRKISAIDPLITSMEKQQTCLPLSEVPPEFAERLRELEFDVSAKGVVLPFHSPEYLEGLLILGERSSQTSYSSSDYSFFNNLISFVAPLLYRLTPMEKLEQLYSENRQRLHEAEIQLIRAQKVEAIAHATRQCHHEIRTPLNIIRMGIGRIKSLEDLENYKKVAFEEIDHALTVVEETLAITDITEESQRRQNELVDVNDIIRRCLRLIDQSRYKVLLELNEVPKIPAMGSDLQVVIINLIHNAIDAMPDGGSLAFASRFAHNSVEIDVEDTGSGIPEAMRSKVWEPYVSGKTSDFGNSTAGRGWGLTIVNRIISEHGGTINFESAVNHGTKFTISLPLAEDGLGQESMDHPALVSVQGS